MPEIDIIYRDPPIHQTIWLPKRSCDRFYDAILQSLRDYILKDHDHSKLFDYQDDYVKMTMRLDHLVSIRMPPDFSDLSSADQQEFRNREIVVHVLDSEIEAAALSKGIANNIARSEAQFDRDARSPKPVFKHGDDTPF